MPHIVEDAKRIHNNDNSLLIGHGMVDRVACFNNAQGQFLGVR